MWDVVEPPVGEASVLKDFSMASTRTTLKRAWGTSSVLASECGSAPTRQSENPSNRTRQIGDQHSECKFHAIWPEIVTGVICRVVTE